MLDEQATLDIGNGYRSSQTHRQTVTFGRQDFLDITPILAAAVNRRFDAGNFPHSPAEGAGNFGNPFLFFYKPSNVGQSENAAGRTRCIWGQIHPASDLGDAGTFRRE
jgi:hypothetical protein